MGFDLRKYAQQTNIRMLVGAILLFLIVGDGLIFIIFGSGAALTGLICLGAGILPLLIIYLVFVGIDYFVKRANRD